MTKWYYHLKQWRIVLNYLQFCQVMEKNDIHEWLYYKIIILREKNSYRLVSHTIIRSSQSRSGKRLHRINISEKIVNSSFKMNNIIRNDLRHRYTCIDYVNLFKRTLFPGNIWMDNVDYQKKSASGLSHYCIICSPERESSKNVGGSRVS